MYFFKFQKAGNFEFNMLRRGELFFAAPSELNDASECRPRYVLKGGQELWNRLSVYLLSEACFSDRLYPELNADLIKELMSLGQAVGQRLGKQNARKALALEDLESLFHAELSAVLGGRELLLRELVLKATQETIRNIPQAIAEPKYIASFSLNARNATAWGHYTDAERGFAIVYKTSDGKLGIETTDKMLHGCRPTTRKGVMELGIYDHERIALHPVVYRSQPPRVNAFYGLVPRFSYSERELHYDGPEELSGQVKPMQESEVGLVKYSDWSYEQEVRAFLPVFDSLPPDLRVVRVSPEHACGLIFGPRMSVVDRQRAIVCSYLRHEAFVKAGRSVGRCMFFRAKQLVDKFDFEIVPIGILNGRYFGSTLPFIPIDKLDSETIAELTEAKRLIEQNSTSFKSHRDSTS